MMVSDLASGITTIIILLLMWSGSLEIWHLYVLLALSSALESFQFPAFSSSITLLVEKKHFARTSAMMSLAEEGSRVLAPILAAALFVVVKMDGIILIDVISFVVAIGTILLVPIPQPPQAETSKRAGTGILKESVYGFRYILANPSLMGLQINFLMVNLLAMAAALRTPMILARTGNNESILGTVASMTAIGGVAGSLAMSIWGGPKRKILGVLGGLLLVNLGRAAMGLGHEVIAWSISGFFAVFFIAVCNSSNQAIWQAKTPVEVQGRVFAARRFTGQLSIPLGALIAGPLSDRLFEPAMSANGSLALIFGGWIGTGPGAGKSLLILIATSIVMIVPAISYAVPSFRNVEDIIPDNDVVSSHPSNYREIVRIEPKESIPGPSTK
jgi:hypothetical protein